MEWAKDARTGVPPPCREKLCQLFLDKISLSSVQFYINLRRTEALSCWKLLPAQLPTEPRFWSLPRAGARGRAGQEPPCSGHMAQTDGTSAGTALLGLQKPFSLVFILVCFLGFLPSSITFLSRISLPHRPPPKALSNLLAASRAEQPSGTQGASNREYPAPKHRLRFDSLSSPYR